jgi:uncharacterized repeat protein (TIGR01451 family)
MVLLDNNGYLVDELRMAMKKNSTVVDYYTPPVSPRDCQLCEKLTKNATCAPNSSPQLLLDTDYTAGNAADQKNIQRLPDGTGIWKEATGGGNSSEDSLCTTNDNILLMTKTASSYSVALSNQVTYTLSVKNGSATTAMTNVSVTDTIPTGLSYVSKTNPVLLNTSTAAGTATVSSGVLTWTIPSLAAGVTATMTITATVTDSSIAITNTAEATATELSGGTTQGSATINALRVTMVANPTSINVGDSTTYTITVQNLSGASIYDVLASLPFPTGITYVSNTAPTVGSFSRISDTSQTWNIGALSAGATATFTITAQGKQAGTFSVVTSATSSTNYPGATYTGSVDVTVAAVASSFNAIDTAQTSYPSGVIQTKIAGTAFSLKIGALASGVLNTSFNTAVKVELVASNNIAATLDANGCPSGGSVVATQNSLTLASGVGTTQNFTVAEAYRNVRVRITDLTSGTISCSTDNFAIRPASLNAVSGSAIPTDDTSSTAGTTRQLTTATAAGTPVHMAGTPFTLRAVAVNAAGTPVTTTNYTTAPTVTLVTCVLPSTTCPTGTPLTGGTFSNSSGVTTSNTANYTDVGVITAKLTDTDFTTVDGADGTTLAQRTVESVVFTIGRFVPAFLETSVTANCPADFAYSRQPFSVTVTAYNGAASPAAVTQYASAITLSDANSIAEGVLKNTAIAAAATPGVGVTTTTPTFDFNTEPTKPKTIKLRATDADSVTSSGHTEGTLEIRSGRFRIENAYGSELLPLSISPAIIQYYAGTGQWTDDASNSCTTLPVPTAANGGLVSGTLAAGTAVLADSGGTTSGTLTSVNGVLPSFKLRKPSDATKGPESVGYVDLKLGSIIAWPAWLPPSQTTTRFSFGMYNQQGAARKIIIRREVR